MPWHPLVAACTTLWESLLRGKSTLQSCPFCKIKIQWIFPSVAQVERINNRPARCTPHRTIILHHQRGSAPTFGNHCIRQTKTQTEMEINRERARERERERTLKRREHLLMCLIPGRGSYFQSQQSRTLNFLLHWGLRLWHWRKTLVLCGNSAARNT